MELHAPLLPCHFALFSVSLSSSFPSSLQLPAPSWDLLYLPNFSGQFNRLSPFVPGTISGVGDADRKERRALCCLRVSLCTLSLSLFFLFFLLCHSSLLLLSNPHHHRPFLPSMSHLRRQPPEQESPRAPGTAPSGFLRSWGQARPRCRVGVGGAGNS